MTLPYAAAFVAAALFSLMIPPDVSAQVTGGGEKRLPGVGGERLTARLARIAALTDSAARSRGIDSLIAGVRRGGGVWSGDSSVTILYRGNARRVFLAGDPNGWNPGTDELARVPGTDLFSISLELEPAARFEYKLVVDSAWTLDPINPLRAQGGFGENSEVRMPRYRFPGESLRREGIARGTIDSIWFSSAGLARRVRVLVYLPPVYHADAGRFPVLYVMDGGEYLALAQMNVVLDNLIAGGTIAPLIAVFVDPRRNPDDPRTNERMREYALNDRFVGVLAEELRPFLLSRYRMREEAAHTAIMGASMGGLISTYAALTRPGVFGLCAAQSPSYQWANDTLLTMLRESPGGNFRMFLSTGTMHDAERRARIARDIMREKGYDVTYVETPEAHNWANWRGRLKNLLTAFWGIR